MAQTAASEVGIDATQVILEATTATMGWRKLPFELREVILILALAVEFGLTTDLDLTGYPAVKSRSEALASVAALPGRQILWRDALNSLPDFLRATSGMRCEGMPLYYSMITLLLETSVHALDSFQQLIEDLPESFMKGAKTLGVLLRCGPAASPTTPQVHYVLIKLRKPIANPWRVTLQHGTLNGSDPCPTHFANFAGGTGETVCFSRRDLKILHLKILWMCNRWPMMEESFSKDCMLALCELVRSVAQPEGKRRVAEQESEAHGEQREADEWSPVQDVHSLWERVIEGCSVAE